MATIKRFEDLESWKKSRELCKEIYIITKKEEFYKDFKFRDQIRGASGSIMDNIAEGFERGNKKEFILFLAYAKGSAGEVRSQLYRAFDQAYIDQEKFEKLNTMIISISKMISQFIKYLKNTGIRGERYK